MRNFRSKVTEITIDIDDYRVATVTKPDPKEHKKIEATLAQVDIHMSMFTADDFVQLSGLIVDAILDVTN
jgi:hypothetical protein